MNPPRWSLPYVRLGLHENLDRTLQLIVDIPTGNNNSIGMNSRTTVKFSRWERDLRLILERFRLIDTSIRPFIEQRLNVPLDEELFASVFFQPSTKNLFLEIATHLEHIGLSDQYGALLGSLAMTCEFAKVLALIGDAALSMASLHYVWRPDSREVGELTQKRSELVKNERLAQLCDAWGLYEQRIHFDPVTESKSEIDHIKGTLIEALCGVLYIQHGLAKVGRVVSYLNSMAEMSNQSSASE